MLSLSTRPTLLSEFHRGCSTQQTYLILFIRVSPVLKEAISSGKINLTAIVNTHQ